MSKKIIVLLLLVLGFCAEETLHYRHTLYSNKEDSPRVYKTL